MSVLKLDNYGKDVETIRLQMVHINQLLTFQRNYKQVAEGKAVKTKGKTPMTAKDGNQNYPKGRSINEETVYVRTLKTILRAQKSNFLLNAALFSENLSETSFKDKIRWSTFSFEEITEAVYLSRIK